MEEDQDKDIQEQCKEKSVTSGFKKPIFVGKVGRLPRRIIPTTVASTNNEPVINEISEVNGESEAQEDSEILLNNSCKPTQQVADSLVQLPYKEPSWSGLPFSNGKGYIFEVLKSGVIVSHINLMEKPFWVFGRSPNCEVYMTNPTISRFHAVLQFRKEGSVDSPSGFYIYDLNSTHGTFLNKGRLKPKVYAPVKVGHMIKLGFSTRSYVLTGPEDEIEAESEFSVTELKQQRAEKILKQELTEKEALLKEQKAKEEQERRVEERGIDWGLGEDADAETDLIENPFAQPNNEDLYIDDPKKALRGFMEREGYDLNYDCQEQGFGQFLCKVELPIDDDNGRPIVAEVLHKGKKKETVVQCALEACRILDRYGVLRRATHESRKRKAKNWEENDYYDSDDDTFLDRTGSIEKKREKRMQSKVKQPETYHSLVEKENKISEKISKIQHQLSRSKTEKSNKLLQDEEDSLDSYMKELKQAKIDKQSVSKLKSDLVGLKIEQANLIKLINLAKPANLPELVNKSSEKPHATSARFPLFGKRNKIKVDVPKKPEIATETAGHEDEIEDETKEKDNEATTNKSALKNKFDNMPWNLKVLSKINELEKLLTENKMPSIFEKYIAEITEVSDKIKNDVHNEDRLHSPKKTIVKPNVHECCNEPQLTRIRREFQRISSEIRELIDNQNSVSNNMRILRMKIHLLCNEIQEKVNEFKGGVKDKSIELKEHSDDEEDDKHLTAEELEKRRKKNQKRLQHRKERAEIEKQKGYREDARREDYNMWMPPDDQTGDGRTNLNVKYGY